MKLAPWIVVLAFCACRRESEPGSGFALRRISALEIAKLERALPKDSTPAEPTNDVRERVRGLVLDRTHEEAKMRTLALRDVASIGPDAVPVIDALIDEKDRTLDEQLSALEVLGAIDTSISTDALAKRIDLEKVREPRIRAQAAFELSKQSSDHVLPRLLAQLKYETDGETVIWIAAALAKHGNYAGLEGLRVLAANGATPEVRADAESMLARVTQDAGFESADALYLAWNGADVERKVPREEPSPRLRLETWRRIAALSEFDLRLVDDARFALSHSAWWVVDQLVAALHEDVPHVRVHVAQCLERMGGRASGACNELVRALDEPHMASSAASALSAIGCTDALDELVRHTQPKNDPELRNAAAAALGRLGRVDSKTSITALRPLLAPSEPLDLRQAAAESLVALGDAASAAPLLVECLTAPAADAGAAEAALEAWLTRAARAGDEPSRAALAVWMAAGGSNSSTPTAAEASARRRRRAAELGPTLTGILAGAAGR
jgi:HEAT repeat protein